MEGKFTIYRLTAPSGQCYIGMTRTSLQVRWLQHVKRAFGEQKQHPLYNAIREYGADAFLVRAIDTATDMETAQRLEQKHIARIPRILSFNLSPGGAGDAKTGVKMFWARMDADPVARRVYLKKLSDIKKANDWTDYKALAAAAEKWRKEHARENYERLTRASRMTRWMRQKPANADSRSRKEKLLWKYKRGEMIRINTTELWNRRTPEERTEVARKISTAQKQIWAAIEDPKTRSAMTAKARASVNRAVQGPAASEGLKRFWEELRTDPARYKSYSAKRNASNEKLSTIQKQIWAAIEDPETRSAMTAMARASIDRSVQGPAASKGLKRFWDDIRADPERYRAYMEKRNSSQLKTLGGKST